MEPERYLRERAQRAATSAPVPISVLGQGQPDRLPGEAGSFDAGVASLVLCTVPDQPSALAELHRVIRPGGELRFYEHVLANPNSRPASSGSPTRRWPRLAGGCHLARDTMAAIERAGFAIMNSTKPRADQTVRQRGPLQPASHGVLGY